MIVMFNKATTLSPRQRGFTLVELMIVVAIIGILAAIAYPNYQRYIIKSKRADMMSEMHNIAAQIQSSKLAQGSYSNITTTNFTGNYPRQGVGLYSVSITPIPLAAEWLITATPIAGTQVADDGALSLDYLGNKCRDTTCNTGDAWNE